MEFLVVPLVAFGASALTLVSGFGLGTLLLPAFALFFPIEVAVGMTAVVHLLNNLFKLGLLGRHADRGVALRFGLPAIAASFLGAIALVWLSGREPLARWTLEGRPYEIEPVGLTVGASMVVFAAWEAVPFLSRVSLGPRSLPLGGFIAGFFGGLSGHQGALRSAFLIRAGLGKESFVATGTWIACAIDVSRLSVYGLGALGSGAGPNASLVATATAAAFAGAWIGARILNKVTLATVRTLVAISLFTVGILLAAGVV